MNVLVGKVEAYMQATKEANKSLSSYITTIIELVEVDAGKDIIIKHLRNIQKVTHELSQGIENGQNS